MPKRKRLPKQAFRKKSKKSRKSRRQVVQQVRQAITFCIPGDLSWIVADYAVPDSDTNLVIRIKEQPTLFLPRFQFTQEFADFYQDVTGNSLEYKRGNACHPFESATCVEQVIEMDESYRNAIKDHQKRNDVPSSLLFVAFEPDTLWRDHSILTYFIFTFRDKEDKAMRTKSLIRLLKHMRDIDTRAVNLCCQTLACCNYDHHSPLSAALLFGYGEDLVNFLREHGATVPGQALKAKGECTM